MKLRITLFALLIMSLCALAANAQERPRTEPIVEKTNHNTSRTRNISGVGTPSGETFNIDLAQRDVNQAYAEYVREQRTAGSRNILAKEQFKSDLVKEVTADLKSVFPNGIGPEASKLGIEIEIKFKRFSIIIRFS